MAKNSTVCLKDTRLNKQYMFSLLFKKGKRLRSDGISIQYVAAPQSEEPIYSKVGFLIRKKTGKAVFRNTLRRKLRSIFSQHHANFPSPVWILFDIPKGPLKVEVRELIQNADALLGKVGKV